VVLQKRVAQRGNRTVAQGLIQWSESTPDSATWEDLDELHRQFPFAPAWGQAGIQEEGIVSGLGPPVTDGGELAEAADDGPRPRRSRRSPRWITDGEWVV
jgi:hypothetical protein